MPLSFAFYGHTLEYTREQDDYNKIRLHYRELAESSADLYLTRYDKLNGLDDFSEKRADIGYAMIREAVDQTVDLCIQAKRYDVDENSFIEQYGEECIMDWVDAFDEINEKYMEIVLKADELDEYRRQRREGRGRLIGGGFGFSGAVKGMMAAGAVNIATGALHSTFNTIGKGISAIGDSYKKSTIYKSKETRQTLWNGIYHTIFNMHYAYCDIFGIDVIPDQNIKTAETIFNNIGRMDESDVLENLVKILTLNPYKLAVYEYCIEHYGDPSREVEQLADHFGYDLSVYKTFIVERTFDKLDLSNEQKALEAKSKLQAVLTEIGIKDSSHLQAIEEKLVYFDKLARTVENILYPTRGEASKASQELTQIKAILNEADLGTLAGIRATLMTFNEPGRFTTLAKKKYIDELHEKVRAIQTKEVQSIIKKGNTSTAAGITEVIERIKANNYTEQHVFQEITKLEEKREKLDISERTVENVSYDTIELANKARQELAQLQHIMKTGKLKTAASTLAVLQTLQDQNFEMESSLQKVAEIETKYHQLVEKERLTREKQEKKKAKNELHLRTVNNFVYDSVEQASKARSELEQAESTVRNGKMKSARGALAVLHALKDHNFETYSAMQKIEEIETKYQRLDQRERTVRGKLYETKQEIKTAKIKAALIPIIVFVVLAALLSLLFIVSNTDSIISNILLPTGLMLLPWALFGIIKPEPASFYLTRSRWLTLGSSIGLSLVIIIISGILR